jgi:hypothetical protein
MSDISPPESPYNPKNVFALRCWVRALLWQLNEFPLDEAVDRLQAIAVEYGLDTQEAQEIIAVAFAERRDA